MAQTHFPLNVAVKHGRRKIRPKAVGGLSAELNVEEKSAFLEINDDLLKKFCIISCRWRCKPSIWDINVTGERERERERVRERERKDVERKMQRERERRGGRREKGRRWLEIKTS